MFQNPELGSAAKHDSQLETNEVYQKTPVESSSPAGMVFSALFAEDNYKQATVHYRQSDLVWRDVKDRLIRAEPKAQSALERCQIIGHQIRELAESSALDRNKQIATLSAEHQVAQKPYVKAQSRISQNPELLQAAANREAKRFDMEKTKKEFEQARDRALTVVSQNLSTNLSWDQISSLLGSKLKQDLKSAEARLAEAIINQQKTIALADESLKTKLKRLVVVRRLIDPKE